MRRGLAGAHGRTKQDFRRMLSAGDIHSLGERDTAIFPIIASFIYTINEYKKQGGAQDFP
jgi:hypothetical protein